MFGRKTEQTSVIMNEGTQLSFFPVNNDKRSSVDDNIITVPEHKRKKKRTHDDWMSELPVEVVLHKEDDPKCDKCDSNMTEMVCVQLMKRLRFWICIQVLVWDMLHCWEFQLRSTTVRFAIHYLSRFSFFG